MPSSIVQWELACVPQQPLSTIAVTRSYSPLMTLSVPRAWQPRPDGAIGTRPGWGGTRVPAIRSCAEQPSGHESSGGAAS
jgi:hypothetical protein